jgi:hypothetical protein
MQNVTKPARASSGSPWLTSYGPFALSIITILIIAVAWFLHDIDQTTALAVIGVILGGNGIVSATQWQAAPGLLSEVQYLIGALISHIQALHQVQLQSLQPSPSSAEPGLPTKDVARSETPAAPTAPKD